LVFFANPVFASPADDANYLRRLAKETYDSILFLVDQGSGLPYDNSRFNRPDTSVSNIGLYLAALVGAKQMGLETPGAAAAKAAKALDSLEKFKSWNGFTSSWNNVLELTPSQQDVWVSVLDSGNLAAGLILISSEFPALQKRADRLLDRMNWAAVYNQNKQQLYGGVNFKTLKVSDNWLLGQLGSDARLAYVIAIGQNKIPAGSWASLSRQEEGRYGLKYLSPGWNGGGLFMQYLSGLFMEEAGTPMAASAARFAFAQRVHAHVINSPVWGWSACEQPSGHYMGWDHMLDKVATPHASVLTIDYFPEAVVENLRQFETLGGRTPFISDGQKYAFGFHDSVDVISKEVDPHFLVLDQSMLFLSLVNHLNNGSVRQSFRRHPVVQNALAQLPECRPTQQERDQFLSSLAGLGADKVIMKPEPLRIEQDPQGNKVLVKEMALINYTNKSYKNSVLTWKIMLDQTSEILDQGQVIFDLSKYSSINLKTTRQRLTGPRFESNSLMLEAKLMDPAGAVISEQMAIITP
jgi:hypothetical protein